LRCLTRRHLKNCCRSPRFRSLFSRRIALICIELKGTAHPGVVRTHLATKRLVLDAKFVVPGFALNCNSHALSQGDL
jgi:hypothetical protein